MDTNKELSAVSTGGALVLAGIALTTALLPIFKKAKDGLVQWKDSYDSDNVKEYIDISEHYRKICYPLEKNSSLTTLNVNQHGKTASHGTTAIESDNQSLPYYFQLVQHEKYTIPRLCYDNFKPNIEASDWHGMLNNRSRIFSEIADMISEICDYQYQRKHRFTGKGFDYDATNIFFEEFKLWLVELSKADIREDVPDIVFNRIRYLQMLGARNTFQPGNHTKSRLKTIYKVKNILEKKVWPTIEHELSRQSALHHFEDLRQDISLIMRDSIDFLFYLFRDSKDTPPNFNHHQIYQPSDKIYIQLVEKTISGKLLHILLNTEPLKVVFFKSEADSSKLNLANLFLTADGQVTLPDFHPKLTLQNWYTAEIQDIIEQATGILPPFANYEIMSTFLRLHGQIQHLALFYLICDKFVTLAGHGGNIMVYGKAASILQNCLSGFEKLLVETQANIKHLYKTAERFKETLDSKDASDNAKISQWNNLFHKTAEIEINLVKYFDLTRKHLVKIEQKIKEVNTEEYRRTVFQDMHGLARLAREFSKDSSIELNSELSVTDTQANVDHAVTPLLPTKKAQTGTIVMQLAADPKSAVQLHTATPKLNSDRLSEEVAAWIGKKCKANDRARYLRNKNHADVYGVLADVLNNLLQAETYTSNILREMCQKMYHKKSERYLKRVELIVKKLEKTPLAKYLPETILTEVKNGQLKSLVNYFEHPIIAWAVLSDNRAIRKLKNYLKIVYAGHPDLVVKVSRSGVKQKKNLRFKQSRTINLIFLNGYYHTIISEVKENKEIEHHRKELSKRKAIIDDSAALLVKVNKLANLEQDGMRSFLLAAPDQDDTFFSCIAAAIQQKDGASNWDTTKLRKEYGEKLQMILNQQDNAATKKHTKLKREFLKILRNESNSEANEKPFEDSYFMIQYVPKRQQAMGIRKKSIMGHLKIEGRIMCKLFEQYFTELHCIDLDKKTTSIINFDLGTIQTDKRIYFVRGQADSVIRLIRYQNTFFFVEPDAKLLDEIAQNSLMANFQHLKKSAHKLRKKEKTKVESESEHEEPKLKDDNDDPSDDRSLSASSSQISVLIDDASERSASAFNDESSIQTYRSEDDDMSEKSAHDDLPPTPPSASASPIDPKLLSSRSAQNPRQQNLSLQPTLVLPITTEANRTTTSRSGNDLLVVHQPAYTPTHFKPAANNQPSISIKDIQSFMDKTRITLETQNWLIKGSFSCTAKFPAGITALKKVLLENGEEQNDQIIREQFTQIKTIMQKSQEQRADESDKSLAFYAEQLQNVEQLGNTHPDRPRSLAS